MELICRFGEENIFSRRDHIVAKYFIIIYVHNFCFESIFKVLFAAKLTLSFVVILVILVILVTGAPPHQGY